MDMCYEGTLVMPSSYAVMNEEEMTYVEGGGWSTYKGVEALMTLTAIAGCGYTMLTLSKAAATTMVATASTPVMLLAFMGVSIALASSVYQYGLALAAAINLKDSYSKTKSLNESGYKACSYSLWTWSYYTAVQPL